MPSFPDAENSDAGFLSAGALLAAIVDSSDDAIVSKNLDGIVTSWNKSAERIFGYTAEEMIGQPILRLIPPDRADEEPQIIARLRRGERIEHFETVRVRKDGTHLEISLTISPVKNASGQIVGASKIARDITEPKRAQRELVEALDRVKRADQMKAEFLATLSHELRTPLNAIAGWTQILKDGSESPEELAEGLAVIERNTRAQTQLIEDLLDMSRIESGKVSLDVQNLDIVAIVNAAIESTRPAAEAKEIRLRPTNSSIGGVVRGDRHRLQQIVWNLLSNAIKFTPKGGRVQVQIERVDSHVEIIVSDNGQGIAPEFLPQVFERFRQADGSTTRRYGGLGLGLSIAKHLIEMHGGEVRVKSDGIGRGATFIVLLPLVAAHEDKAHTASMRRNAAVDDAAPDADLRGIKVLAVDDEVDSAEVVKRLLEAHEAEVQTAHGMEEALKLVTTFQPDIVLSDIGMPEHDGYEFVARLRSMPGGKSIPVVALTALARSEDRTRALRAGFQMHVAKPVDATELVAVVMNLATLRGKWRGVTPATPRRLPR